MGEAWEADPAVRQALHALALGFPRLFHCTTARVDRSPGGRRIFQLAATAGPGRRRGCSPRGSTARNTRRTRTQIRTRLRNGCAWAWTMPRPCRQRNESLTWLTFEADRARNV